MARLRAAVAVDASEVPEELLDQRHEVWADADLFAAWARRQHGRWLVHECGVLPHWASRHRAATEAWAVSAGLVGAAGRIDRRGLDQLGIPWSGALAQARARSELADQ